MSMFAKKISHKKIFFSSICKNSANLKNQFLKKIHILKIFRKILNRERLARCQFSTKEGLAYKKCFCCTNQQRLRQNSLTISKKRGSSLECFLFQLIFGMILFFSLKYDFFLIKKKASVHNCAKFLNKKWGWS